MSQSRRTNVYCCGNPGPFLGGFGPGTYHGASITPALLRWNFLKHESSRFVPWTQLGWGVLWTTQRFPQEAPDLVEYTSHLNFTPQFGVGESIFVRRNQSLNFGVRAVHIYNAGLSSYDPGVNVVLLLSAGYSWWK